MGVDRFAKSRALKALVYAGLVNRAVMNVRFEGNNGHDGDVTRCLLMTQSGHHALEYPR